MTLLTLREVNSIYVHLQIKNEGGNRPSTLNHTMKFKLQIMMYNIRLLRFLSSKAKANKQTNTPNLPTLTLLLSARLSCHVLCAYWVASVMSNSLQPYGLWPARLFCPWDPQGKNTGVGSHVFLQVLVPT